MGTFVSFIYFCCVHSFFWNSFDLAPVVVKRPCLCERCNRNTNYCYI